MRKVTGRVIFGHFIKWKAGLSKTGYGTIKGKVTKGSETTVFLKDKENLESIFSLNLFVFLYNFELL